MSERLNVEIDNGPVAIVMARYGCRTKREAINLALRMAATAPRTEEERDLALTEQLLAHYRAKPERLAAMLNGLAEARVGERVTLEEARAAVTGA